MRQLPLTSPASHAVFRRILSHGPTGRVEIARATGLSQAAVTKAVTPLLDAGFVVAGEAAAPAVGRPVSPLSVAAARAHVIGVKVTADRTYGVLTGLDAGVVARSERILTTSAVPEVVAVIASVVGELRAASPTPVEGVGVAISGDVDRVGGIVRDSPLLGWHEVQLAALIEAATGLPSEVENDVRALTVTEQMFGAGRDATSFALVTIGAGIGCGLSFGETVLNGAHGVSGELGHIPLADEDTVCSCGRTGCVEAVASTDAVLARIRAGHDDEGLTIVDAFRLAHADDPTARSAFERAGEVIGSALATLANLFGPELIVISGENVTEYRLYERRVRDAFAQHAFGAAQNCEIVLRPHLFDDWARGAATCVIESLASGRSIRQ